MGSGHIPPRPPLFEAGGVAGDKIPDCRQWSAVASRVSRAYKKPRHVKRLGAFVALRAIEALGDSGWHAFTLVQRVKFRPAFGVHRSYINDRAIGGPADINIGREIDRTRGVWADLLA